MDKLKFPIGELVMPTELTKDQREAAIAQIKMLPRHLRSLVDDLPEEKQCKTYREGAWNVRELVHHLADSHVELYYRLKLAVTEGKPLYKDFDENLWAALPDMALPMDISLNILGGIHYRVTAILEALSDEQWTIGEKGPNDTLTYVEQSVVKLSWHGMHHLEHIKMALAN